jgi:phosphoesterase RecJ-like protein
MSNYPQASAIQEIIANSKHVVVIQADNPDADSLGSALAMESLLANLGKEVSLYCAVDMPTYLKYMTGWDRVSKEIPRKFDASIIVDASTMTLLEQFEPAEISGIYSSKPCVVLDHHAITDHPIPFVDIIINDTEVSSAGELIYNLGKQLDWPFSVDTYNFIASSILGDTQGLTNELAKPQTYRVMADLIDNGVNRTELEEIRRDASKMPKVIFRYKADLINRTELYVEDKLAIVVVPQHEINEFSPLYNPGPLIQGDILQTQGVQVAIVLKQYDSGKITASIRANYGFAVAGKIAEHFGGGGHKYASGFKITNNKPLNEVKSECIEIASQLLQT